LHTLEIKRPKDYVGTVQYKNVPNLS